MKSGEQIYRKLMLTGVPEKLVPELGNGELRSLLIYAGAHAAPCEDLLSAAIVEAATRFLKKGSKKSL